LCAGGAAGGAKATEARPGFDDSVKTMTPAKTTRKATSPRTPATIPESDPARPTPKPPVARSLTEITSV
jgi:hypothetical protein